MIPHSKNPLYILVYAASGFLIVIWNWILRQEMQPPTNQAIQINVLLIGSDKGWQNLIGQSNDPEWRYLSTIINQFEWEGIRVLSVFYLIVIQLHVVIFCDGNRPKSLWNDPNSSFWSVEHLPWCHGEIGQFSPTILKKCCSWRNERNTGTKHWRVLPDTKVGAST